MVDRRSVTRREAAVHVDLLDRDLRPAPVVRQPGERQRRPGPRRQLAQLPRERLDGHRLRSSRQLGPQLHVLLLDLDEARLRLPNHPWIDPPIHRRNEHARQPLSKSDPPRIRLAQPPRHLQALDRSLDPRLHVVPVEHVVAVPPQPLERHEHLTLDPADALQPLQSNDEIADAIAHELKGEGASHPLRQLS